jgi:hypothetical protein
MSHFSPFWTHNGSIMEVVLAHVGPITHMSPHTLRGVYKGICAPHRSGGHSAGAKYRVGAQTPYLDPSEHPKTPVLDMLKHPHFGNIPKVPISDVQIRGVPEMCTY